MTTDIEIRIKAKIDDLEKKVDKVNEKLEEMGGKSGKGTKAVKGLGAQFKDLESAILPATAVLAGFGVALKKTYDLGKEGASLEYAAGKFDRLAVAAGTTSKVLLTDLRAAVKGTRSDMELMASAGDLMSLGLAKNHDEVVRFTRVAGALDMDMNQLVLTLTNQTKARFDQLHVSVDGFDERLENLKKTGLSTDEAFREAFLQQAEEQINKVGDAAETNVGKIARLESTFNNLGDSIKLKLAKPLADFADTLNLLITSENELEAVWKQHETTMRTQGGRYQDYVREMVRAANAAGMFSGLNASISQNLLHGMYQGDKYNEMLGRLAGELPLVTEQQWNYIQAVEAGTIKVQTYGDSIGSATGAVGNIAAASKEAEDAQKGLETAMKNLTNTAEDYLTGTGNEVATLLENKLGPNSARYRDVLDEIDDVMGTSLQKEWEHKDAVQALVDQYARTGDQEAFRENLQNLRDSELPGVTDELEAAVLQAQQLYDKLMNMPKTLAIDIYINEHGNVDIKRTVTGGKDTGGQKRTQDQKEYEYATGGSYVVPQGYFENWPVGGGHVASSGETVEVHPTGRGKKGDRSINVTINASVASDIDLYQMAYRVGSIIQRGH